VSEPDRLDGNEIRNALAGCVIGHDIVVVNETTSTNDFIRQRTTSATPEGFVVFAERQTAGRGQRANRWESVPGKGLWFSILLRPKVDIADSPKLSEWAARTVARTIADEFALPAKLKLPNDILVAEKKIAGVLVEMRAQESASPHVAILGIGVNVNHRAEDFSEELRPRAISIAMARNEAVSRQKFATALLRNLDRTYRETFAP
jgi:BirA family transcriptional regulator, biotin operon repressor / biotin---[acetyl-CoA-carboxylase] ligase